MERETWNIAMFCYPGMSVPNHQETQPISLRVTPQCRRPILRGILALIYKLNKKGGKNDIKSRKLKIFHSKTICFQIIISKIYFFLKENIFFFSLSRGVQDNVKQLLSIN